jgi:hypothetical protein
MKIVQSLVEQIGGDLQIAAGGDGQGARFTVTFGSRASGPDSPDLRQPDQGAVGRAEWDRIGHPSFW